MSDLVVDWESLPIEEGPGGVRRRRHCGERAELVMVEAPAGGAAPRHNHEFEQFVQVLAGEGELECDAGARPFKPGTLFHLPRGTWHAATFKADTVLLETNLDS